MKRDPNNHTQPATDYKAEFAWTISWVEGCSHGKSKHQRHSSTHDIISMLSCRIQCAKSERCADEMKWNPSQQSCNIIGSHSGIIKFKSIKAIHSKSVKLYPRPHISLDTCTKNTQYITVTTIVKHWRHTIQWDEKRICMCVHIPSSECPQWRAGPPSAPDQTWPSSQTCRMFQPVWH